MSLLVRRPSSERASRERVGRNAVAASAESSGSVMPDELSPRRLRRRVLEVAAVGVVVGIVVVTGPGLGQLRSEVAHASPDWLIAGIGLEVLSALSYVVIFRAVFCPSGALRSSIASVSAINRPESIRPKIAYRREAAADGETARRFKPPGPSLPVHSFRTRSFRQKGGGG